MNSQRQTAGTGSSTEPPAPLIDTNVWLSHWPFRRLPEDDTPSLCAKLRKAGVTQAWVSSFDMLLHRDIAAVNLRLAAECAPSNGLLVPFGAINLALPDWQDDVRRCSEVHGMPGLRIVPAWHQYDLADRRLAELLDLVEEHNLLLQIALKMEDDRTQHPLVNVPLVNPAPLLPLLTGRQSLRVQMLNSLRSLSGEPLARFGESGRVWFEISMQEGVGGVAALLRSVPLERILFGSYFPFFALESALLKLKESELAEGHRRAISADNAHQLLRALRTQ